MAEGNKKKKVEKNDNRDNGPDKRTEHKEKTQKRLNRQRKRNQRKVRNIEMSKIRREGMKKSLPDDVVEKQDSKNENNAKKNEGNKGNLKPGQGDKLEKKDESKNNENKDNAGKKNENFKEGNENAKKNNKLDNSAKGKNEDLRKDNKRPETNLKPSKSSEKSGFTLKPAKKNKETKNESNEGAKKRADSQMPKEQKVNQKQGIDKGQSKNKDKESNRNFGKKEGFKKRDFEFKGGKVGDKHVSKKEELKKKDFDDKEVKEKGTEVKEKVEKDGGKKDFDSELDELFATNDDGAQDDFSSDDLFDDDLFADEAVSDDSAFDELFADSQSQDEPVVTEDADKAKVDVEPKEAGAKAEKKKSYLEVLQEEAEKFEKMEAERKSAGKDKVDKASPQEPDQGSDQETQAPKVDASKVDASDDWLNFVNQVDSSGNDAVPPTDGAFAEASDRVKEQQDRKEGEDFDFGMGVESSVDKAQNEAGIKKQSEDAQVGVQGNVNMPSAGFHRGKQDELFSSHGELAGNQGMKQKGEVFSGAKLDVESASESIAGEEAGSASGHQVDREVKESVSEKDSETLVGDALNSGRAQINEVLEGTGKGSGGEFMKELKAVLAQAGFSFSAVVKSIVFILILFVLIFGLWQGWYQSIWKGITGIEIFGGGDEVIEEPKGEDLSDVDFTASLKMVEVYGEKLLGDPYVSPGVQSAIDFGEIVEIDRGGVHAGIATALEYGETSEVKEEQRFAYYVEVAGRLRNLYLTDLQQLLGEANDREKALSNYLVRVRDYYQRGLDLKSEIDSEILTLQAEFEAITDEKNLKEEEFFDLISNYQSVASEQALEEFIELRKRQDELRSMHNALSRLSDDYEKILGFVAKKIEAIQLNRDALIKGVQVVPIPGGNIGVIQEEQ